MNCGTPRTASVRMGDLPNVTSGHEAVAPDALFCSVRVFILNMSSYGL